MAITLCLSCSSDAQPEPRGPLCWVLVSFTASYQHLLWTPTHQGPMPLRPGVAFPTPSSLQLAANPLACRTQLSYIIVRRPLDFWNRMFNRHQAEITVMQFRGHSLPVHRSVVGPSPCPILSALIRPRDIFRLLAIGMCHFLPVHHFGIAFLGRVEGQNITVISFLKCYCVEPSYNCLSLLLTLLFSVLQRYTSTLYTIHSYWHFSLRGQVALLMRLNREGFNILFILEF